MTLPITGICGSDNDIAANVAANLSEDGRISSEWNGPLTTKGIARFAPASFAATEAFSTPSFVPEITICPGQLTFAT
ncbi:hypothetical protein D3C79_1018920 [compost metagenome]